MMAIMTVGGDRVSEHSANLPNAVSQTEAAKLLNVSTRGVTAAAKVQQSGVPELAAALDAGEVSISAAADHGKPVTDSRIASPPASGSCTRTCSATFKTSRLNCRKTRGSILSFALKSTS